MESPTKDPSQGPTHISTTFTLVSTANQENPKSNKAFLDTISSLIRNDGLEILRAATNTLDVQDKRKSSVNCSKDLKMGTMEEVVVTLKDL